VCTPLAQMRTLVRQMIPALKRGAIVTDMGSVKASGERDLETLVHNTGAQFVASHPMAGAEKTGVSAARADLFQDAVCVITPTRRSRPAAVAKAERFWKAVGARVVRLSPGQHDALVSRTSHLPHVTAAALANLVLHPAAAEAQALLCANGFRDTTRIASGSPEMWRDIALANRKNLDRALGQCRRFLKEHKIKSFVHADTAGSAEMIAQRGDKAAAAIASTLAGELNGLTVLAKDIEDAAHNTTRFLAMSRQKIEADPMGGDAITSFVFEVRNVPAALYKAMGGFATNGINMVKLESYMVNGSFTATQFYAEIEGHPDQRAVELALEEIEFFCKRLKVLGVYPASPYRKVAAARG